MTNSLRLVMTTFMNSNIKIKLKEINNKKIIEDYYQHQITNQD